MAMADALLVYSWVGLNRCYETGEHFCLGYASVAAAMSEWIWRPTATQVLLWRPNLGRELVFDTALFVSINLVQALIFASTIGLVKSIRRL
jgi:hypothetical protein